MKIKDRLTKKDYRIVFIIVLLGLGALAITSCSKHEIYPDVIDHHVIIVDETTYLFSSSKDVSNPNIPILNGDTYSYDLSGNSVTITTDLDPELVIYRTGALDTNGTVLVELNGHWHVENMADHGYFEFKY